MIKNPSSDDTLIERMCRDILTWDSIDISYDGAILIETRTAVTYKILDALSKTFKTDEINLSFETREECFYDECCRPYTVTIISIYNAKFNIEDIHVCPMQEDSCGECW